jgi:hypothetical protein
MDFKITNNPPDKTYLGQIITYKIGVLPFLKSNWITEITHFESPLKNETRKGFFVDEQRFGLMQCGITSFRRDNKWRRKNDGYCQF